MTIHHNGSSSTIVLNANVSPRDLPEDGIFQYGAPHIIPEDPEAEEVVPLRQRATTGTKGATGASVARLAAPIDLTVLGDGGETIYTLFTFEQDESGKPFKFERVVVNSREHSDLVPVNFKCDDHGNPLMLILSIEALEVSIENWSMVDPELEVTEEGELLVDGELYEGELYMSEVTAREEGGGDSRGGDQQNQQQNADQQEDQQSEESVTVAAEGHQNSAGQDSAKHQDQEGGPKIGGVMIVCDNGRLTIIAHGFVGGDFCIPVLDEQEHQETLLKSTKPELNEMESNLESAPEVDSGTENALIDVDKELYIQHVWMDV